MLYCCCLSFTKSYLRLNTTITYKQKALFQNFVKSKSMFQIPSSKIQIKLEASKSVIQQYSGEIESVANTSVSFNHRIVSTSFYSIIH